MLDDQGIMEIDEKHKKSIKLLSNKEIITDDTLEKLLENCGQVLSGKKEGHDISALSESKNGLVEVKQIYASLLYVFTQFVRNSQTSEEFLSFIVAECNIEKERAKILEDYYEKWFKHIRIQLLNIGNHLPHVTDVRWKIDYVVKSNSIDQSDGPVFRISLKTEKFDCGLQGPRIEFIEFTCNSQEMQDLVYKLKDAVRHCQKLAVGH